MTERRWWTHSQNLNDKPGNRTGSKWVHGRAWFYAPGHRQLGVEWAWSLKPRRFGWRVSRGGKNSEHDAAFSIHFGWFSLYLHSERLMPRWWRASGDEAREYGLSYVVEDGYVGWDWHAKEWESSSRDPWWMHRGWFVADVFLGSAKYSVETLREESVVIPMPERAYPATVKLELARWKRPRWPWAKEIMRADVDIPGGVPVPGKGENSWDCGEDGIYGQTAPARTVEEAIANVVQSALKSRRRYGGKDWRPAPTTA